VKFSDASWAHDDSGFFYCRYDEPKSDSLKATNYFQKVYFHKLDTPQSDDTLVYERPDQKGLVIWRALSQKTAITSS
jgi:prolyl oligopeptidase